MPVIEQLAINTADRLDFYDSLTPDQQDLSYGGEVARARAIVQSLAQQSRLPGRENLKVMVDRILANHLYLAPTGQTPG
jgi:hypothetical protein